MKVCLQHKEACVIHTGTYCPLCQLECRLEDAKQRGYTVTQAVGVAVPTIAVKKVIECAKSLEKPDK